MAQREDSSSDTAPGVAAALADPGRWSDLGVRMASGAAMAVLGALAVMMGGLWFQMLTVFVTAVMVWELWMMIEPGKPTPGMLLAALCASVLSGQLSNGDTWVLWLFLIAPLAGAAMLRRERLTFLAFALGIEVAGWGLVTFRAEYGFTWLLWLILVVICTDVFGYVAGRALGGPKFWPKVSPKKTWSGTSAGWISAGVVGLAFSALTHSPWHLVWISMLLSFASQMGDIAESALKRRMKVKDSSALIPGHGGLFDRFDAMLGASLFMLLASVLGFIPGVHF
ncbi:phosphatidate cytidylyltransferase [Limimaricola variabilis]|uniref:Phosphatidate cytidylyltransferase n=1 Tax=Limimaricola variabilis TaxID=1492771 RepID=A0ABR6HKE9_9RHOB|nr:phosphatidate cytidylyltransferase [Limimaricola variabilis]MBB3710864.1 phosphatidate cytidylyltransferase [Limimaricola variabilis]